MTRCKIEAAVSAAMTCVVLGVGALSPTNALADLELALVAPLEHTTVAMSYGATGLDPLHGVEWESANGSVAIPRILVVPDDGSEAPAMNNAVVVAENLQTGSGEATQCHFDAPITSATGAVWVVIELPEPDENGVRPATVSIREHQTAVRSVVGVGTDTWVQIADGAGIDVTPIRSDGLGRSAHDLLEIESMPRKSGWWNTQVEKQELESDNVEGASVTLLTATRARPVVASPNPFNPRLTVSFYVSQSGPAVVLIYDVRGRRVRTLVEERRLAGEHTTVWDGADDFGTPVSSGVYFVHVKTLGASESRRVALVR